MQETQTQTGTTEEFAGIPELVLLELPNGGVTGVVMREMRASFHVTFAGKFAEPDEVERGIEILRRLDQNDMYGTWKKETDIDAASLDEAIASSPESPVGQKFVSLYRGNEWLWGIWNNPNHPKRSEALRHLAGVDLQSVADFPIPVIRRSRPHKRARSILGPATRCLRSLACRRFLHASSADAASTRTTAAAARRSSLPTAAKLCPLGSKWRRSTRHITR